MKVEITDVQRLTLKPGDRLVVRTGERLDQATAERVRQYVRGWLDIPDDVPLVVLESGMSVEAVEGL